MKGNQLLHYTLGEKLGQGGMGEVYLAHDNKLDREVAIKLLPPSLQESPEARVRLIREAQAASRLTHPHIVAIYAVEQADGQDFIVMEYVRGRSLADAIASGTYSLEQSLDLAREIAEALAAAHETGVVHRDIKPSNILITDRDHAKILDFGLATFYGATQVTEAGATMGTASYMSPEQTEGRPFDHRSDLFSFGVMLFEMIAGRRPFEGDSQNAVAYAICNHAHEPLARYKSNVPPVLEGIVTKALRKDPTERYQSAADMLADIKVARRESSGSSPQPGGYGQGAVPHTPSQSQYTGAPVTPSGPAPHYGAAQQTPSQSMPPETPEKKERNTAIKITSMIVGGLIAITAIVVPRIEDWRSNKSALPTALTPAAPNILLQTEVTETQPTDDRTKIAVLPFKNLGEADEDYFADGVTEEITARLASVQELGVIARTSVNGYKDSKKSARDIGRELDVDYILNGTVRWQRAEGEVPRVRVTPELVRVSDGTSVWADVYDEPMTAVFRVQSNIAKSVASKLDIALREPEQLAMESAPTENMEAYDAYLQGMKLKDNWTSPQTLKIAAEQFKKAATLDPEFLMAWTKLSELNADIVWFAHDQSEDRVKGSREAAEHALEMAPDSPDAQWAMGWHYYHGEREFEKALRYLEPVLEARPGSAEALSAVAYVQRRQGRFEDALANLLKATELNPKDATLQYSVGETYVCLREYARARPYLDRSTELRPELPIGRLASVIGYCLDGDLPNARRVAAELSAILGAGTWGGIQASIEYLARDFDSCIKFAKESDPAPNNAHYRPAELMAGMAQHAKGDAGAARASFEAARDHLVEKVAEDDNDFRYHGSLGVAYAALGMKEEALRHADRAIEILPPAKDAMRASERREELAWTLIFLGDHDGAIDQLEILMSIPAYMSKALLRNHAMYDPLRENPRFKALLEST